MASMTSHERILAAGRRQQPDRVPSDILFEPRLAADLRRQLGTDDLNVFFKVELHNIGPDCTRLTNDCYKY